MSLRVRQHNFNSLPAIGALVLGVLLIGLAIPGLVAEGFAFSGLRLADRLNRATEQATAPDVEEAELASASRYLDKALQFVPGNLSIRLRLADLQLKLYYLLQSAGRASEAQRVLDEAQINMVRSLEQAPGDANFWYLSAELEAMQNQMHAGTLRRLAMSYISGPREGWVAIRRTAFALRYWLLLDPSLKEHVRRELKALWNDSVFRPQLARLFAANSARVQREIYNAISDLGEAEASEFIKAVKGQGWKGDLGALVN